MEVENKTLSIKEAATLMNVSQQYLRDMMRFNLIDIGMVVKMPGNHNHHYIVCKDKLEKLMKGV